MAERIEVELVDDIDGSPAQHTITFALDGMHYEIDVNAQHAKQLRSTFEPYVDKARKAEKADKPRSSAQREREERRHRQENKQLTEQIRLAAQRTREQKKAQQERQKAAQAEHKPAEQEPAAPLAFTKPAGTPDSQAEPAAEHAERGKLTTPAVPVPQFTAPTL